jgi:hypothetical protein
LEFHTRKENRGQIGHVEIISIKKKQRPSSYPQGMAVFSGIKSIFTSIVGILLFILVLSPNAVDATALTYKIDANEKGCFYAWVDKVGEKVAFYFAVAS